MGMVDMYCNDAGKGKGILGAPQSYPKMYIPFPHGDKDKIAVIIEECQDHVHC